MIRSKPLVTFVACAHNEPIHDRAFVTSMLTQTCQDFHAVVFHNGYNTSMGSWIQEQNDGRWDEVYGDHIQYKESKVDTGMWGTVNRQQTIQECDTDYIIQTSVQDYWLPQAVEYINQGISKHQPHILIWNSVNHIVGPCQVLDAQLAWSKVDWGNFAIRTDIARKVGIQHGDKYIADWLFISDVLKSGLVDTKKILKLNAILTIHN